MPYFNELWHPVSPGDVITDSRLFVKTWSELNYLSNGNKMFCFEEKFFYYDIIVMWSPGN